MGNIFGINGYYEKKTTKKIKFDNGQFFSLYDAKFPEFKEI